MKKLMLVRMGSTIACFLMLRESVAYAGPSTQPTTTAIVAVADTPTATFHRYLTALDSADRKAALECWNTTDPKEAAIAELQADMMLAVSKLKKVVRSKFGTVAPFDLQMAVVSEDECGPITEQVTGEAATVEVASTDEQQPHNSYSMIRAAGPWKLSAAEQLKNQPANVPFDAQLVTAKGMIAKIAAAADAVDKGELHSVDDVKRRISESIGGP
jgi:hypothetical protein